MGRVLIATLAALISALLPTTVTAQPPSIVISRTTRDHQQNAGKVPISHISRLDCLTDDSFDLTLALEQFQGYSLEIWAGVACDNLFARHQSTATCWKVASAQPSSPVLELRVGVRDLLSGRTGGSLTGNDETSSNVPACEAASGALAPQVLDMYVLLLDETESVGASALWKSTYKLTPPPPRDLISVTSGDQQLSVELSPMVSDQTFDGTLLFCDPAPNDPNALASTATTTDDAGVFVPGCSPSSELVPGADAAPLLHLQCGSAYRLALTAVADGLVNGVSYHIAAASVDTYGNVGPLSGVACQVPQARESNVRAQACTFAGSANERHGSALLWLGVFGATLFRRSLERRRRARCGCTS